MATLASIRWDFRSKNSAWLMIALTDSALNGLAIRKAGSGAWPVRNCSGNAVMKMTGASSDPRISLTASRPELPSASCRSARMRPGLPLTAARTASAWVRAMVATRAQLLDEILEVHGDEGLVLNDQHFGADLLSDASPGLIDQIMRFGLRAFERFGDLFNLEGFQQRSTGRRRAAPPGWRRDSWTPPLRRRPWSDP